MKKFLSGATRSYLKLLRAKNYFLSDPEGIDDESMVKAVKLGKKAEALLVLVPKNKKRQSYRSSPGAKRKKIRKAIEKTYFKKSPKP